MKRSPTQQTLSPQKAFLAHVSQELAKAPHARQVTLKKVPGFLTEANLIEFINQTKDHPTLACIDVSSLNLMSTLQIHEALKETQAKVVVCTKELAKTTSNVITRGLWKEHVVVVKDIPCDLPDLKLDIELYMLKTLSVLHPAHFIHYYHTIFTLQSALIVMEYARMGSLCNIIDNEPTSKWPMERRYPFMSQMAHALDFMHKENFLHLDIKPDNYLMVSPTQIKLTDFGLSVIVPNGTITLEDARGTPGYISPEMLTEQAITTKTDIFSLSMTYTNLVRWDRDIFDSSSSNLGEIEGIRAIVENTLKGIRPDLPADCPPNIAKHIKWGWHDKPKRRPEALQMAEGLKIPMNT